MPLSEVQAAVETFLRANWTVTDLAFENDGYEPQVDVTDGSIAAYVYVEIMGGLYEQRSIGAGTQAGNFWITSGQLWCHVFVPSGSGSLVAKQYGDALAALLRGLELAPVITFGDIDIGSSGGTSDGNNWRISVSTEWVQG